MYVIRTLRDTWTSGWVLTTRLTREYLGSRIRQYVKLIKLPAEPEISKRFVYQPYWESPSIDKGYSKSKDQIFRHTTTLNSTHILINSVGCLGLFLMLMPPAANLVNWCGKCAVYIESNKPRWMQGMKTLSSSRTYPYTHENFPPLFPRVSLSRVHSGVFAMYHFLLHTHSVRSGTWCIPRLSAKDINWFQLNIAYYVSIKLPLVLSAKKIV